MKSIKCCSVIHLNVSRVSITGALGTPAFPVSSMMATPLLLVIFTKVYKNNRQFLLAALVKLSVQSTDVSRPVQYLNPCAGDVIRAHSHNMSSVACSSRRI